jgi:hypothetical protein
MRRRHPGAGSRRAPFTLDRVTVRPPASRALDIEFAGTAVTSLPPITGATDVLALNPHLASFDSHRGHVSCTASMDNFPSGYRAVEFTDRPGAPISIIASFRLKENRLQRIDLRSRVRGLANRKVSY